MISMVLAGGGKVLVVVELFESSLSLLAVLALITKLSSGFTVIENGSIAKDSNKETPPSSFPSTPVSCSSSDFALRRRSITAGMNSRFYG